MLFQSANCVLALETDAPLRAYDGAAKASFSLSQGESATFVLEHVVGEYEPHGHSAQQIREFVMVDMRLLSLCWGVDRGGDPAARRLESCVRLRFLR